MVYNSNQFSSNVNNIEGLIAKTLKDNKIKSEQFKLKKPVSPYNLRVAREEFKYNVLNRIAMINKKLIRKLENKKKNENNNESGFTI